MKIFHLRRKLLCPLPKNGCLRTLFPRITEAAAAVVQRGLSIAPPDNYPWCYPCDTGFTSMWNAGIAESWKLPPRFQENTWEARQRASEREGYKVMRMNLTVRREEGTASKALRVGPSKCVKLTSHHHMSQIQTWNHRS